jgi:predicted O-linked N-acetylglucosamine transferase (SPINDLY family)
MASSVRQSMGLGIDASVSTTFGDLSRVAAGSGYLCVLGEILKRFPNHFHLFAGPGDVKTIRAYLHSEGVLSRVRFLGHTPDVSVLLQAADVYLAFFPNSDAQSIAEARDAGKPIVALQAGTSNGDAQTDPAGAPELLARTEAEYIDMASRLIRIALRNRVPT